MLNLEMLNEFSRPFAESLFRKFPEWQKLAEIYSPVHPDDSTPDGSLSLAVPSPTGILEHQLGIYTRADSYLVYFSGYHEEEYMPVDSDSRPLVMQDLIDLIESYVAEQSVVIFLRHRFLWLKFHTTEIVNVADIEKRRPVAVISWLGTHNRGIVPFKPLGC